MKKYRMENKFPRLHIIIARKIYIMNVIENNIFFFMWIGGDREQ